MKNEKGLKRPRIQKGLKGTEGHYKAQGPHEDAEMKNNIYQQIKRWGPGLFGTGLDWAACLGPLSNSIWALESSAWSHGRVGPYCGLEA